MNTEAPLHRAYAHWLKDGLFEIGVGILLTGVGTLRAIIYFAGAKSSAYYGFTAGLIVFMLSCVFGFNWIGKALKARITYPRTGYFTFKPPMYSVRNFLALLALLVAGGILGGTLGILATQPDQARSGVFVPIVMGLVVGLATMLAAQRVDIGRLYYEAAFSVVIGLSLGTLGVGVVLGVSYFYLGFGLVLIVLGSLALMQFLRKHKPVDLNRESS